MSGSKSRAFPQPAGAYLVVEAMIAMAVFAIGFLAAGTLAVSTVRTNGRADMATRAAWLAAETIEGLKSAPLAALASGHDPGGGGPFEIGWQVTDTGIGGSRKVAVTVAWQRFGRRHQLTLSTITMGGGR